MSDRRRPARKIALAIPPVRALAGALATMLASGCLVYDVARVPVTLAAKTVIVAGETTGAVVSTTGKVAVSAVRATGSVATGGLETTTRLARTGMVTFADAGTGKVTRVAWTRGLTLARAGDAAKVSLAARSIEIVRDGRAWRRAEAGTVKSLPLESGDVIRLASGLASAGS